MAAQHFSPRELEQLVAVLIAHKNPFDFDYAKYAEHANYKTTHSAQVCFTPIRKKLKAFIDGSAGDETAEPTANAPSKSSKKATTITKAPSNRKRKPASSPMPKEEDNDDIDNDDETATILATKRLCTATKNPAASKKQKMPLPPRIEGQDDNDDDEIKAIPVTAGMSAGIGVRVKNEPADY